MKTLTTCVGGVLVYTIYKTEFIGTGEVRVPCIDDIYFDGENVRAKLTDEPCEPCEILRWRDEEMDLILRRDR